MATSYNVTSYFAESGSFEGSGEAPVLETLKALFWSRYRIREADYRLAAEALTMAQVGLPCSVPESSCTGQPGSKNGPSEYLKLNKFDGGMTFIDTQGIFRFRICVDYAVEQVDQTCPDLVAHLEPLVRAREME